MSAWPTSVATDANLSIAVNSLQTTLGSGIDAVVTTIPLASTTGFPTAGYATIDNEVLSYTGVSGGNLTGATRGADGTSAATHSTGAAVSATIVAAHHNSLKDEVKAIETTLSGVTGLSPTLPLTVSKAMVTDSSGHIAAATTTAAEIGFVAGLTSAVQTQINGKQATLTAGQLPGTATNDSATAGNVGEAVRSAVAGGSNVAMTNGTFVNITSISLTAGDWDVSCLGAITANTVSNISVCGIAVSKFSGNTLTDHVDGDNVLAIFGPVPSSVINAYATVPVFRMSLSTTTTVFLKGYAGFTTGTIGGYGRISARRVR